MNIVIFITAKDYDQAAKISQHLVDQKLIACANILNGVKSLFWWEGKVDEANEVLLILKTRKSLFKKIEKAVKALHSYEVPEIIALPIIEGHKPYLKWVNESTKK